MFLLQSCHQLTSNGQVSEEEPARDEGFLRVTRGFLHDVQIWGVEAQSCGRETISHQVDPEQLDWNQSLREAQRRSKKDAIKEMKYFVRKLLECPLILFLRSRLTKRPPPHWRR